MLYTVREGCSSRSDFCQCLRVVRTARDRRRRRSCPTRSTPPTVRLNWARGRPWNAAAGGLAPPGADHSPGNPTGPGADAVILDLGDAVPTQHKADARRIVAAATATTPAWVRVNAVRSTDCDSDLDVVGATYKRGTTPTGCGPHVTLVRQSARSWPAGPSAPDRPRTPHAGSRRAT
ncbi:aldolase/citrate lyase family protein [Rhodococcus opacus]|uniref:aldolase/citrate lyase family protein n=1 Tax=Rhodococcus opacus TaxID=37919 RepID=UPI0018E484F0